MLFALVPDARLYLYPQTVTGLLVPILTRPSVQPFVLILFLWFVPFPLVHVSSSFSVVL